MLDGEDLRPLPLSLRKTNLAATRAADYYNFRYGPRKAIAFKSIFASVWNKYSRDRKLR
jgi:hypothetical protein